MYVILYLVGSKTVRYEAKDISDYQTFLGYLEKAELKVLGTQIVLVA